MTTADQSALIADFIKANPRVLADALAESTLPDDVSGLANEIESLNDQALGQRVREAVTKYVLTEAIAWKAEKNAYDQLYSRRYRYSNIDRASGVALTGEI